MIVIRPKTRNPKWRWQTMIDEHDGVWIDGHQSCYFNRLMDLGWPVEDMDAVTDRKSVV